MNHTIQVFSMIVSYDISGVSATNTVYSSLAFLHKTRQIVLSTIIAIGGGSDA